MHVRFVASVLEALAGGFVVVASQAFAAGTTAWLAFALGVALLVLAAVPVVFKDRKVLGLSLDGLTAVLGAWTVVASLVFSGATVTWLSFAEGLGFVGLALTGLTLNQWRLTRSVTTSLQVAPATVEVSDTARPIAA
jgi:hypothetical protein